MAYLNRILNEPTPQSEPLPDMVPNSAGGHVYPVDDMTRLRRFLILGSEGGSYYADERKLTLENAAAVKRCIENDGPNAVYEIAYISRHGRAPKVGPPLFALAMAATYGHLGTRALAFGYLSQMARTGSQLQMFIDYIGTMRGWGRSLRRAVGQMVHSSKDIKQTVYQAVKYRQRYNWTHRDLLRKAHPKAGSSEFNDLLRLDYPGARCLTRTTSTSPLSTPTSKPRRPTPQALASLIRAGTT